MRGRPDDPHRWRYQKRQSPPFLSEYSRAANHLIPMRLDTAATLFAAVLLLFSSGSV